MSVYNTISDKVEVAYRKYNYVFNEWDDPIRLGTLNTVYDNIVEAWIMCDWVSSWDIKDDLK